MWIMTKDGFFSVVRHKDDPTKMMVRVRVREDLVKAFGNEDIVEDDKADYRFRKAVGTFDVMVYMSQSVENIDYTTNVKGTIDQGDSDRHRALYETWDAWYTLQEAKYGKGRYSYDNSLLAEDAVLFTEEDDQWLG